MNFKKILFLFLALAVVTSLASCKDKENNNNNNNQCSSHVDADDDYLCDKCGENFDDGDEAPSVVAPTEYDVTFVVKLDNGDILSGVKFTLTRGEKSFNLESGSNGTATQSLEAGPYAIEYDYDTRPEYCTPDTFGFKVEEGTSRVELIIVNNTPDGSAEKPFTVTENETEITVSAGESVYFVYRGTTIKKLTINETGLSVIYDGTVYNPDGGVIKLDFHPEIGKETIFAVKNNTESSITTVMSLIAPLGSSENPISLTENSATVSVNEEEIIYYKWISDMKGVLILTSNCVNNNISLTKVTENDILIVSQTTGNKAAYLAVEEGDEVTIGVSAIDTAEVVDVDFTITTYAGTDSDPVPVLLDNIDISLVPNQSIVFAGEVGKTLHINDENRVSVYHDTITFTNELDNEIVVELLKPLFVLNNYSEYINGISISFE